MGKTDVSNEVQELIYQIATQRLHETVRGRQQIKFTLFEAEVNKQSYLRPDVFHSEM
jgi:hypothetical protein